MTFPSAPLVSTDWLAAHLDDPKLRILDASYRMPAMGRRPRPSNLPSVRLPGAAFFDIDAVADPTSSLPHMVPSPQEFAEQVGALGIGDGCRVGLRLRRRQLSLRAARLVDVQAVRLGRGAGARGRGRRNGGAEAAAAASGAPATSAATLTPRFEPERLRRIAQLIANLDSGAEQVVERAPRASVLKARLPSRGRAAARAGSRGSFIVPFNELARRRWHAEIARRAARDLCRRQGRS
ncbi:MAG: sulfurtransferase [Rhodopseudomonas palustris]|nr:sulfurtransferase [Rhodopseudomonas palustris]